MILFLLALIIAYTAGSVNFSILLFKVTGKEDPRSHFSGNPGVSNVYRQAGPGWAVLVLSLDLARAAGVAFLSTKLCSPAQLPWIALALIVGNMFPMFHHFRGGKGVANYLGFTAIATPWAALLVAGVWLVIFIVLREPFFGSFGMIAVLSLGLANHGGYTSSAVLAVIVITASILYAHRANIRTFYSRRKKEQQE